MMISIEFKSSLIHPMVWVKKGYLDARNESGNTPLHEAARDGRLEICEFLIKHDADVNAKNTNGETPLDIATKKGYDAICERLKK